MPPKPEPMLASPQMEPTTFLGYTSAGKASMMEQHPVYPSMASDTRAMEVRASRAKTAGMALVMSMAKSVTRPCAPR